MLSACRTAGEMTSALLLLVSWRLLLLINWRLQLLLVNWRRLLLLENSWRRSSRPMVQPRGSRDMALSGDIYR